MLYSLNRAADLLYLQTPLSNGTTEFIRGKSLNLSVTLFSLLWNKKKICDSIKSHKTFGTITQRKAPLSDASALFMLSQKHQGNKFPHLKITHSGFHRNKTEPPIESSKLPFITSSTVLFLDQELVTTTLLALS